MSWPEHFYKHNNHEQISAGIQRQTNSLSARAMHLSIYGSMVILLASYNKTLSIFFINYFWFWRWRSLEGVEVCQAIMVEHLVACPIQPLGRTVLLSQSNQKELQLLRRSMRSQDKLQIHLHKAHSEDNIIMVMEIILVMKKKKILLWGLIHPALYLFASLQGQES